MKKFWIIGLCTLICAGGVSYYFYAHHKQKVASAQAKVSSQNTYTVTTGSIQSKVHGLSVVQSTSDQSLSVDSQQTIDQVKVHVESTVKKGQTLVTFDKVDLSSEIAQANQQLSMDQISYNAAVRNRDDSKTQPNYSLQDKVNKAYIVLQADKEKIQSLENKEVVPPITAPFSGKVVSVSSQLQSGQMVNKGTTLLEITNMNQLQLVLPIDELDILKVQTGQSVNAQLNAMPNQKIQGKVSSIADVGKVQNGVSTFDVTVDLKSNSNIKPGMTGQGDILTANKKNILVVPIAAVQMKKGQPYVMIYQSGGKNKLTKIMTGIHNASLVEVTSGLKKGDKIIIPKKNTISTKKSKGKKKNKNSPLNKMFGGKSGGKKKKH